MKSLKTAMITTAIAAFATACGPTGAGISPVVTQTPVATATPTAEQLRPKLHIEEVTNFDYGLNQPVSYTHVRFIPKNTQIPAEFLIDYYRRDECRELDATYGNSATIYLNNIKAFVDSHPDRERFNPKWVGSSRYHIDNSSGELSVDELVDVANGIIDAACVDPAN